uniref:Secreted protein n=1 Tax=Anguilla anguilla TaxID=7936 RepID=A0A0E9TR66_ANGAN
MYVMPLLDCWSQLALSVLVLGCGAYPCIKSWCFSWIQHLTDRHLFNVLYYLLKWRCSSKENATNKYTYWE